MKLKDRVAIVTGGGKGIGEEICLGLSREGARIVIAEIDIENSEEVINLIAKKKIDVVCFLGGGIANNDLINSPNIACLNFHSGISPYYNGSKTIFHALSDFRPNFCGGTLMKMSEKIDGGDILLHYLIPINEKSTPGEIFVQGIIGSVKLYKIALNKISSNMYKGVPQSTSYKYLRNIDWNIIY